MCSNVSESTVLKGKHVGHKAVIFICACNKDSGNILHQIPTQNAFDLGCASGQIRFRFAFQLPVLPVIEFCNTLRLLCVKAENKNIFLTIAVKIGYAVFRIVGVHQFGHMAVCVGISAERLQNIGGQLPADDKFDPWSICQLYIFHACKAGAITLNHICQVIVSVCVRKDTGSERLVSCCFQKCNRFVHAIAVEIGQLHRLLVYTGHRRGIGSILAGQDFFNRKFQPVILVRMPRQRI